MAAPVRVNWDDSAPVEFAAGLDDGQLNGELGAMQEWKALAPGFVCLDGRQRNLAVVKQ